MTPPPPPPPPPSGPGPYGQSPYGQPQYGQPQIREHPDGTTILVLGILGLVVCGILAPIAWSKGNSAKREIDARPDVQWTNAGSVNAGRICGMIGTILLIVAAVFFVLALTLVIAGS